MLINNLKKKIFFCHTKNNPSHSIQVNLSSIGIQCIFSIFSNLNESYCQYCKNKQITMSLNNTYHIYKHLRHMYFRLVVASMIGYPQGFRILRGLWIRASILIINKQGLREIFYLQEKEILQDSNFHHEKKITQYLYYFFVCGQSVCPS